MIRVRASVAADIGSVEYKLPVASVSYILINSSAYQDSKGLYQYKTEFATVADESFINFSKAVSDGVSTTEAIQNFVLEKLITDAVVLSETINILITIILNLSSTATVGDVYANLFETIKQDLIITSDGNILEFQKNNVESVSATDVYVVDISKSHTETVSATDSNVISYENNQSETITSNDVFSRVANFVRDFDEPQVITEEKYVDFNKPIFDLQLLGTLNEVQLNTLGINSEYKESKDYIYTSDVLVTLLDLQRSLVDSISTPTDILASDVGKGLADSFSTTDRLSSVIQTYDPDLINSRVLNTKTLNSSY